MTVAVSFGAERDAAFEHAKNRCVVSMPQVRTSELRYYLALSSLAKLLYLYQASSRDATKF